MQHDRRRRRTTARSPGHTHAISPEGCSQSKAGWGCDQSKAGWGCSQRKADWGAALFRCRRSRSAQRLGALYATCSYMLRLGCLCWKKGCLLAACRVGAVRLRGGPQGKDSTQQRPQECAGDHIARVVFVVDDSADAHAPAGAGRARGAPPSGQGAGSAIGVGGRGGGRVAGAPCPQQERHQPQHAQARGRRADCKAALRVGRPGPARTPRGAGAGRAVAGPAPRGFAAASAKQARHCYCRPGRRLAAAAQPLPPVPAPHAVPHLQCQHHTQ